MARHRVEELATAMEALGVADHRFLGGPGRWRDSGMAGTPTTTHERAFAAADVDDAAAELAAVVREVRPQVVVTYDADGGYGHPDHVQAHAVTLRGVDLAGQVDAAVRGEPWQVAKVYAVVQPRSALVAGLERLRAADTPFAVVDSVDQLGMGVDDAVVTTTVDASEHLDAKVAALRAHATQVSVAGAFYALSNGIGMAVDAVEHFSLLRGETGEVRDDGREDDLFAGVSG